MGVKENPENLIVESLYKAIPNKKVDITVNSSSGTTDLKNIGGVDVTGKMIRLKAIDDDITLLRGTHTLTVGSGLELATGDEEEFYVDPGGETVLSHIAVGDSKTLRVFYNEG